MGNIPATYKDPGVFVTIDNSLANTSNGAAFQACVFGQMIAAGTATAEVAVQVFSTADAQTKFGVGSNLAEAFDAWFANNIATEVWCVPLDDAAASAANVTTLTFQGTATAAGTASVTINNKVFDVSISSGDVFATATVPLFVALINADTALPCVASDAAGALTLTAKNAGTLGNDITYVPESKTDGITVGSNTVSTPGSTDPDIADAIAALPDEVYQLLLMPYTDATNLGVLKTELDRRWGALVQLDGVAIVSFGGSPSTVTTKGDTLNSAYLSVMDAGADNKTPPYLDAAIFAAQVAGSAEIDPARPFRTLTLVGADGDVGTDRRSKNERNQILNSGISTHEIGKDGTVRIGRAVTTYKTNAVGAPDTSYLNLNTPLNLSFIRQSFKAKMLSLYPRHKLAEDGISVGPGQPIATPSSIKGEIITWYKGLVRLGLVQDVDGFAETLSVTIDGVNVSRINVVMQPKLIGQFYQIDNTLQFTV